MKTILEQVNEAYRSDTEFVILFYSDKAVPPIAKDYNLAIHYVFDRKTINKFLSILKEDGFKVKDFSHIVHKDNSRYTMRLVQ
jgi:hypothetical protein